MRRALPVALALVLAAGLAGAADMALTTVGTLYRATYDDDAGIVVTETVPGEPSRDLTVPVTAGTGATAIQVSADAVTGGLYLVWQSGPEADRRVELAWFTDETWFGPYTLAGGDGTVAHSPETLLHRTTVAADWYDDDGNPITVDVELASLHMVWWQRADAHDNGVAIYDRIPIEEDGMLAFGERDPIALTELLPYGIACQGIDDVTELASPKLFLDPQSGNPHVMATDLADCLIQILELQTELGDEPEVEPKRRRTVIILRTQEMLYINPDLPLASAEAVVGHDLSVVLHWDADQAVEYIQLEDGLWSDIRSLTLSGTLDRAQAIDLIRSLVR